MSNTTQKPVGKSRNFWTGIITVVTGAASYFLISPDVVAADVLAGEAHKAVDAISTKNYVLLFGVLVNAGNIIWHLFDKK